jgi:GntR family transcriptional regulator
VSRPSLVDVTETALRQRLAPGRARPGDRLPPEKELADSLGVSRGTLRLALERLESNGEVNRRQGSGTFVGRVAMPAAFSEGLEVLESYASLARRQGKQLTARDKTPLIQRTLIADGTVAAHMRDIVHPEITLPPSDELRSALESGKMMLDVLVEHEVPIAFARTHVNPRLVEPESRVGQALDTTRLTATLELVEVMHLAEGEAVQYSTEVFPPGSLDLHVMRSLAQVQG